MAATGNANKVGRDRRRAEQLASALPPLLVAADRVASTVAPGIHGRRRVGQGETFWQFRHYEFGDSPQQIDWRRSARTDQLFVRETEWEAAQSVWLWRDYSPSMHYRSQPGLPTKQARADLLTMALMALLVRGGERIALLGDSARPATGRAALTRLAATLAFEDPTAAAGGDGGIPPAIPLPRHATVVLMGDFLSPYDSIDAAVRTLAAQGVRGHMLQVLDPAEASMPFTGRSRFLGLEAEGELLVGRAQELRDSYLDRLDEHQSRLQALARVAGWTMATHHTDRPAEPALLALFVALTDQPRFNIC
ncbi:MAG: DUF58 domain-containing protein [Alphaproteobacteria bacterium]